MKGLEAFEEVRRLIVIAAHPDDMETMCGGAVALLAQRGVTVFSVNCTLGDIGAQDPVRGSCHQGSGEARPRPGSCIVGKA